MDSYYTILLIAIEYYGHRYTSLDKKLNWILSTLEKNVGRIPEREFLFALMAFSEPAKNPFFGHQWPVPYNRQQNVVDLIRNMAWDLSFYRTLQTWATKTDQGDFAVPLFLTFDWKLAGMTEIYTTRLMLLDDIEKHIFSYSPLNVRSLLEVCGLWNSFKAYFSPDRVAKRMKSRVAYDELSIQCTAAEQELHQIVYSRPYEKSV